MSRPHTAAAGVVCGNSRIGSRSSGSCLACLNEWPPQRVDVVGHNDVGAMTRPSEHDVQQPRQSRIRRPFVAVILIRLQKQDRGSGFSALCLMQIHDLHRVWAKARITEQRTMSYAIKFIFDGIERFAGGEASHGRARATRRLAPGLLPAVSAQPRVRASDDARRGPRPAG